MVNFDIEFLKRCRAVTNHYEKKEGSWSPKSQVLKIYEETTEIQKAKELDNLLEECCDTILAVITIFDLLGIPYDRVQQYMEKTLKKVESRIEPESNDDPCCVGCEGDCQCFGA